MIFTKRNLYLWNQTQVMISSAFKFLFCACELLKELFSCALNGCCSCFPSILSLESRAACRMLRRRNAPCTGCMCRVGKGYFYGAVAGVAVAWGRWLSLPVEQVPWGSASWCCSRLINKPSRGCAVLRSGVRARIDSPSIILIGFPRRAGAGLNVLKWVVNETTQGAFFLFPSFPVYIFFFFSVVGFRMHKESLNLEEASLMQVFTVQPDLLCWQKYINMSKHHTLTVTWEGVEVQIK